MMSFPRRTNHGVISDEQSRTKTLGSIFAGEIGEAHALEDDQALLIRLKIDRNVARTELSRSVLDPTVFKKPISAVVDSNR